jgi:hypothetical protein
MQVTLSVFSKHLTAGMSRAVYRVGSMPWLAVLGYFVEFDLNEIAELLNAYSRAR